jgi:hypothetical protein
MHKSQSFSPSSQSNIMLMSKALPASPPFSLVSAKRLLLSSRSIAPACFRLPFPKLGSSLLSSSGHEIQIKRPCSNFTPQPSEKEMPGFEFVSGLLSSPPDQSGQPASSRLLPLYGHFRVPYQTHLATSKVHLGPECNLENMLLRAYGNLSAVTNPF